jgi:hypothetical protein
MKARRVVVTVEVESELSLKDLKLEVKTAIDSNVWQTSVKQIQVNAIQEGKDGNN